MTIEGLYANEANVAVLLAPKRKEPAKCLCGTLEHACPGHVALRAHLISQNAMEATDQRIGSTSRGGFDLRSKRHPYQDPAGVWREAHGR